MRAYIDESGNTGFNLFDPVQPYFLTAAMSSPVDFDVVFKERVENIARKADVDHLHASEMGVAGVESIARRLIDLIEFSEVRFHFVLVNKPELAAMKFFDAVFDPGENPAVPPHTYNVRLLKFALLWKFVALLNLDDAEQFWDAMTSAPSREAESKAVSAIDNVLGHVHRLPDARSRQLISDTLYWARNNISEFSFWSSKKEQRYGNLPNLFTLPFLFNWMSKLAEAWSDKVDKIIHDQQSQFGDTLRQWHELMRSVDPEPTFNFGDTPIRFGDIRDSQFEISDARVSPGLQVVDVVLWVCSRSVADKPIGPNSTELLELCRLPEDVSFVSLGWILTELEYGLSALMGRSISEEQLREAEQLLNQTEQARQSRIR